MCTVSVKVPKVEQRDSGLHRWRELFSQTVTEMVISATSEKKRYFSLEMAYGTLAL